MKLTAYGITDVGLQRSNNEDCFYFDEQLGLFIVADGMGGHAAGEIASRMAVEQVRATLESRPDAQSSEALQQMLATAVTQANRAITQAAKENPAWSGMGTTLTILQIFEEQAFLAHVGDSRLYRWDGNRLEQLSDDHTLVADQLRHGLINETEAEQSNLGNILLQAVGVSEELNLCQKIIPLQTNTCFLLCSDGLTGMLTNAEISSILAHHPLPEQGCKVLLNNALAAGGKDNITAVLVTVGPK